MMIFTAVCSADECVDCHKENVKEHHGAVCTDCHIKTEKHYGKAGKISSGAVGCVSCHSKYEDMSNNAMVLRHSQKAFTKRIFGEYDNRFYAENCSSCHVQSCSDCHGTHDIKKPETETCLKCHNDHAVGIDYVGLAPRPQAEKYQRGEEKYGKHYLKMIPDVHYEAGMACGDCHSMSSIHKGEKSSKTCTDCHEASAQIISHREHDNVECVSCHAGWSYGEYGTFYMNFISSRNHYKSYASKLEPVGNSYVRSAILHEYNAPVLGVNSSGKIAPIRPFITFYTEFREGKAVVENELVSNEWSTYSPHTIRREARGCESCHNSDKRLMDVEEDVIYNLKNDGIKLSSFWNSSEMKVYNGRFLNDEEIAEIKNKSQKYKQMQVDRWQKILKSME